MKKLFLFILLLSAITAQSQIFLYEEDCLGSRISMNDVDVELSAIPVRGEFDFENNNYVDLTSGICCLLSMTITYQIKKNMNKSERK